MFCKPAKRAESHQPETLVWKKPLDGILAFLDSDDLWDAPKLEKQLAFMRDCDASFSFTGYRLMTETVGYSGRARPAATRITYRDMLRGRRVGTLTVMLDTEKLGAQQFPLFHKASDLGLWLKILASGRIAHALDEELATYRVVSSSVSRNKIKYVGRVWKYTEPSHFRSWTSLGSMLSTRSAASLST